MSRKTKEHITLSLPEGLVRRFRQFLSSKYGTVQKGLISGEVELALEAYMADHRSHTQNTQTNLTRTPNPTPLVHRVREEVKEYMKDKMGYEIIYQVPLRHVEEAIAMVRGSDRRTVVKWLKNFKKYKVLKHITFNMVEFL